MLRQFACIVGCVQILMLAQKCRIRISEFWPRLTFLLEQQIKSMRGKFPHDIYLEYFVIFGVSWFLFGTDTTQPSQSCMALVISVRYACKCEEMAALRIESFSCSHDINPILTGFNSTRQRIQVKFKAKIVNV